MDPTRAGSRGRAVTATTNSFEVTTLPTKTYYQFDVVIRQLGRQTDKPPNFRRCQEVIDKLQTQVAPQNFTPKALYDGRAIMFATHELGISRGGVTIQVPMSERPQPSGSLKGVFEVRISRTTANPITPTDVNALIRGGNATPESAVAVNLLQMLIRQHFNKKYPNNNRAYFTNAQTQPLGGGIVLWRGFFQSVRPTIGRMLINVDTAIAAMYRSGSFIDVAMDVLGARDVRDLALEERSPKYKKLEAFLKKLTVKVKIGSMERRRTVRSLISAAGTVRFSKEGVLTTVGEHFVQTYNTHLRYPMIVGVVTSPKSAENQVVYPAECCEILPGQFFKKKIPEELYGKTVLDFATMRPSERLGVIQQGVRGGSGSTPCPTPIMEYSQSEAMINSGMKVSPNPVTVPGRLLEPPRLGFGNQDMDVRDGAWNVVGKTLNAPESLKAWAVVSFVPGLPSGIAEELGRDIQKCCQRLGMSVEPPSAILVDCDGHQCEKRLTDAGNVIYERMRHQPQLLIIILPQAAAELRLRVKNWGDVSRGVSTQCVRENKIYSRRQYQVKDQYCNNVAIKINSRLGGKNFVTRGGILDSLAKRGPFMVVGADVTHPGPGVANRPSVASLAFSWDREACRYVSTSRVQNPRLEIIDDLKGMMVQCFRQYYDLTKGFLPSQLYFFRDGVSEGELEKVERLEVEALQEAIDEAWAQSRSTSPKAKLTFIIVGKRHHVRFFPAPHDGDRKSGNCKAGFVADRGLSSAFARDFYLLSHGGLLGTSRPSHYIVLRNDNGGSMDDIQALAFDLCHVYAKATRSVSIPAPVYYADQVCTRANFYFDPNLRFTDDSTVSSGGPQFDLAKWQSGYGSVHVNLRNRMYFL